MADISKCGNGEKCSSKHLCYRWTAPASERQSYADFYKEGEQCKSFWPSQGR